MKKMIITYTVKADRASENEEFIKKVFEQLQEASPEGYRYASFVKEDGVSFIHIASVEREDGSNPVVDLTAFKEFQENIKDRCETPPIASEMTEIGSYRVFN